MSTRDNQSIYSICDTSYLEGKTFTNLTSQEENKFENDLDNVLDRFLGDYIKFQTACGGEGENA